MFCSLLACYSELSGLWVLFWLKREGCCLRGFCLVRGSLGVFCWVFFSLVLFWVGFGGFY